MTGKSLCEMRGYVSTSTQLLRSDFSQLCIFWERRSDMRLLKKKIQADCRPLGAFHTIDCLGCRYLRRHSQLQTWWTHIFISLSFHFFFFSSRLPWLVVSLSASSCASKGIIYHFVSVDLRLAQQIAWPGNRFVKCADAYQFRRKWK